MSFFRKASNTFKPVNNFFKKASSSANTFFKKGGDAEHILHDTSVAFRKTGNTLGQVNTQAGKVLGSDIAQHLASSMGAEGLAGLKAVRGVNSALGVSADLSHQVSQGTNKGNYRGSSGDVVNNALERASRGYDTGRDAQKIHFK